MSETDPNSVESPEVTRPQCEGGRLPLEPMDEQLTSIQPGSPVIVHLELFWGRCRRWLLKTFRPSYVARMRETRQGEANCYPHEILDPRDLKFHRNQGDCHWDPADDPFAWRDRIPFARVGLAELLLGSLATFAPAAALAAWGLHSELAGVLAGAVWTIVIGLVIVGGLIVWFFRDPERRIPDGAGVVVSPADGTIATVEELEYDEFVDGPAVEIGIFLSIFNVHLNRMPVAGRVIGLRYKPGKYLNALKPESVRENEQLAVRIESSDAMHRRMTVRQISGAIARRIVCWVKPGDELGRGERFGMIKFGSRTVLVMPRSEELEIRVQVGDKVQAGATVVARYAE